MTKRFSKICAQGDIMFVRINRLPAMAKKIHAEKGQYIVAHSENGGHHIIAECPSVQYFTTDNPMVSYLQVVEATDEAEVLIEHLRSFDTHESIVISPGIYEIRRQREYTPEGWRKIND